MQTEQLLCWSGITDTEHSTSSSNEEERNISILKRLITVLRQLSFTHSFQGNGESGRVRCKLDRQLVSFYTFIPITLKLSPKTIERLEKAFTCIRYNCEHGLSYAGI